MIAPLLLAAGLLAQTSDTTLLFQAWHDVWRRPLDSSVVSFRQVIQRSRASGARAVLASAYAGLGFLASRKGGIAPALALFDSAMRVGPTGNANIEPQIRCTRASVQSFGGLPGARDEARLGLLRATEARSDSARGWCWHALASVALNESTNPTAVLALLDSAIIAERASGDEDMLGISLFTRGYLLQAIGNLAEAKRDLGRARHPPSLSFPTRRGAPPGLPHRSAATLPPPLGGSCSISGFPPALCTYRSCNRLVPPTHAAHCLPGRPARTLSVSQLGPRDSRLSMPNSVGCSWNKAGPASDSAPCIPLLRR